METLFSPAARPPRQAERLPNHTEVNSLRWQWDTVAGGTCWTSFVGPTGFMRLRVSHLTDSLRGVLPREPFDSPRVCGTFFVVSDFTSSSSSLHGAILAELMRNESPKICGFLLSGVAHVGWLWDKS